jgi:hypothetical protein
MWADRRLRRQFRRDEPANRSNQATMRFQGLAIFDSLDQSAAG